mgnify:CR=1 FL=1
MILYFPMLKEENNVDDKIIKREVGSKSAKQKSEKKDFGKISGKFFTPLEFSGIRPIRKGNFAQLPPIFLTSTTFQPISHRGGMSSS